MEYEEFKNMADGKVDESMLELVKTINNHNSTHLFVAIDGEGNAVGNINGDGNIVAKVLIQILTQYPELLIKVNALSESVINVSGDLIEATKRMEQVTGIKSTETSTDIAMKALTLIVGNRMEYFAMKGPRMEFLSKVASEKK